MSRWASEKNAIGLCDRCGFRYPLRKLRKEMDNLVRQNLRVCPECWDEDHPQSRLGRKDMTDAQALRDPRPQGSKGGRILPGDFVWDFVDPSVMYLQLFSTIIGGNFSDGVSFSISGGGIDRSDPVAGIQRVNFSSSIANAFQFSNLDEVGADADALRFVSIRYRYIYVPPGAVPQLKLIYSVGGPYVDGESKTPLPKGMGGFDEVAWDMEGVAGWTGGLTNVEFQFFSWLPAGVTAVVEVERFKLEAGTRGWS